MRREKYIESQLAKRLGKRRKSEGEDEGDGPQAEEDDLYNIPDNLKVRSLYNMLMTVLLFPAWWTHSGPCSYSFLGLGKFCCTYVLALLLVAEQRWECAQTGLFDTGWSVGAPAGPEDEAAGRVGVDDGHPGGAAAHGLQAEEHRGDRGRQEAAARRRWGRPGQARTPHTACQRLCTALRVHPEFPS